MCREEIIQVNTLSTSLLALLLVPWMKQQRGQRSAPARVVFVSSGLHMSVDIKPWFTYAEKEGGVLAHYSKEENFQAGLTSPMYNYSKLMLMYALEEVSKMALNEDGEYVWSSNSHWHEQFTVADKYSQGHKSSLPASAPAPSRPSSPGRCRRIQLSRG